MALRNGTDVTRILKLQTGQLGLVRALQDARDATRVTASTDNETKLVPLVPSSRNPKFVGREENFESLDIMSFRIRRKTRQLMLFTDLGALSE